MREPVSSCPRSRTYSPRVHELHRLSGAHLEALLAFELENRAYFARSISDRGDQFYEAFSGHHEAFLAQQDTGGCAFYVLVDRDGSIVGRFNLDDLADGAARVGYRVAEQVAGRGVATEALRDLCRKAATDHGLRVLSAETSKANVASQRVLEKAGFTRRAAAWSPASPGLSSRWRWLTSQPSQSAARTNLRQLPLAPAGPTGPLLVAAGSRRQKPGFRACCGDIPEAMSGKRGFQLRVGRAGACGCGGREVAGMWRASLRILSTNSAGVGHWNLGNAGRRVA
jgi:ribosomal-protein-alanine N-acetyltransferase